LLKNLIRNGMMFVASLLTACSIGGASSTQELPVLSDSTITTTTVSPDELPAADSQTTIVRSASLPECDFAAIAGDAESKGMGVVECVGDWMITQESGCGECETLTPWHAESGVWKPYFPLYIVCWTGYVDERESPEIANARNALAYIYSRGVTSCDGTLVRDYQPERAQGRLKFGDFGDRVKRLQTALVALGFLDESIYVDNEDSIYEAGMYGWQTTKAVMNFQYSANLTTDGVAGMETHAALKLPYPQPTQ
jgi:hypothetical protein